MMKNVLNLYSVRGSKVGRVGAMGLVVLISLFFLIGGVGATSPVVGANAGGVRGAPLVSPHTGVENNGSNVASEDSFPVMPVGKKVRSYNSVRRRLGAVGVLLSPRDIEKIRRSKGELNREDIKKLVMKRIQRAIQIDKRIRKIGAMRRVRESKYRKLFLNYEERVKKGLNKHRTLQTHLRDMRKKYRECLAKGREEINGENCSEIVENYTKMAKEYLYNSISVVINKLEQVRTRLEESKLLNETVIEARESKINETLDKLREFQEEVNESENMKELRQVALNYSRYMSNIKFRAYRALEIERMERFEFVIEKARVLETRMRVALDRANLSDEKKQEVADKIDEFNQHIDMAEQYREEALKLLRNADKENFGQVVSQVNREYLPKMKDELKEAHKILQEIWNEYIRNRRNMREVVMGRRPLNSVEG